MSRLIMVIDDDLEVLVMVGQILDIAGYDVILFPTIFDNLADVAALAPDLILIDMMIEHEPKGANMLGSLLGNEGTAKIPIVACTGAARAAHITQEFLRELNIPLLRKPFAIDELLRTVEGMIGDSSTAVNVDKHRVAATQT